MRLTWACWLLPAVFVLALVAPVHGQSFGFPWWRDPQFQKDLSLTADQASRVDGVFQSAVTVLRPKKEELDQQEAELSRLIAANADELIVTRQVDKVEAIRSNLNKMRTLMLLHMRQVLTPDQRVRLNKMHEQWEKDHAKPRGDNTVDVKGERDLMTRNGFNWMLAATLACASLAAPARAQAPAQQVSEARIRELIKQAAEKVANGSADVQQPAPNSGGAPGRRAHAGRCGEVRARSQPRHRRAAAESPDQRPRRPQDPVGLPPVAGVDAQPAVGVDAGQHDPGRQFDAGSSIVAGVTTFNGGIAQSVPWGGGNYVVDAEQQPPDHDQPEHAVQPVLQHAVDRAPTPSRCCADSAPTRPASRLASRSVNRDISDVQLRATITNTLSNVRDAYWDYVYAVQAVDVAQQSLTLAAQLVKDNQTRVEVGTMAPIDVVQAQSQAATAQQNLVAAQGTMRTTELALKRLIVGGAQDPNWNVQLNPVDRPDFRPEPIDLDAAVRRALARTHRPRHREDRHVKANDVTLKYLDEQLKPQADLVGRPTAWHRRRRHPARSRTASAVNAPIISTIPGGYGDALDFAVQQPALDRAGELLVSARHQLAGSVGGARQRAVESGAGAGQADRAAGRHRRDQRRRSTCSTASSACRRPRRPASWRRRRSRPSRASSKSACRPTTTSS